MEEVQSLIDEILNLNELSSFDRLILVKKLDFTIAAYALSCVYYTQLNYDASIYSPIANYIMENWNGEDFYVNSNIEFHSKNFLKIINTFLINDEQKTYTKLKFGNLN